MDSKEIKEFGLQLGYSKVGITLAEGFPDVFCKPKIPTFAK